MASGCLKKFLSGVNYNFIPLSFSSRPLLHLPRHRTFENCSPLISNFELPTLLGEYLYKNDDMIELTRLNLTNHTSFSEFKPEHA
jgi:hypothetical protein